VDPNRLGFSVVGVEVPLAAVLVVGKLKAGAFVSAGFWAASEAAVLDAGAAEDGNWKRLGFVAVVFEEASAAPPFATGLPNRPPVEGVEVGVLPNKLGVCAPAPAPPNSEDG